MGMSYIGAPEDEPGYRNNHGPEDEPRSDDECEPDQMIACAHCERKASIDYAARNDWFIDIEGDFVLCPDCDMTLTAEARENDGK